MQTIGSLFDVKVTYSQTQPHWHGDRLKICIPIHLSCQFLRKIYWAQHFGKVLEIIFLCFFFALFHLHPQHNFHFLPAIATDQMVNESEIQAISCEMFHWTSNGNVRMDGEKLSKTRPSTAKTQLDLIVLPTSSRSVTTDPPPELMRVEGALEKPSPRSLPSRKSVLAVSHWY